MRELAAEQENRPGLLLGKPGGRAEMCSSPGHTWLGSISYHELFFREFLDGSILDLDPVGMTNWGWAAIWQVSNCVSQA